MEKKKHHFVHKFVNLDFVSLRFQEMLYGNNSNNKIASNVLAFS